jgi:hypothetical protein
MKLEPDYLKKPIALALDDRIVRSFHHSLFVYEVLPPS